MVATRMDVVTTEAQPIVDFSLDGPRVVVMRCAVADLAGYLLWGDAVRGDPVLRRHVLALLAGAVDELCDAGSYEQTHDGVVLSRYQTDKPEAVRRQFDEFVALAGGLDDAARAMGLA